MKESDKNNSINKMIEDTLKNLKTIVDANTIFGETIVTETGTTIIPVSKVVVGFVVGGGEYSDLSSRRVGKHYPMAGGSGGGITLIPVGFIIDTKSEVKFISTDQKDTYERILKSADKLLKIMVKKKKGECNEKE